MVATIEHPRLVVHRVHQLDIGGRLPVVATAVGGNTALVQPGFTGILVPPCSPDLMAAAIADYCRIPEMGARQGTRARSQVIARHSLPAMARGYDSLLGHGPGPTVRE